jgi:hypothetical protein
MNAFGTEIGRTYSILFVVVRNGSTARCVAIFIVGKIG